MGSPTNTWLKEENLEDQVIAQIQGSDKNWDVDGNERYFRN